MSSSSSAPNVGDNMPPPRVHPDVLAKALEEFIEMMVEEEVFKIGKDIGRQLRWGELETLGLLDPVPTQFEMIDAPGVDIFGQPLSKKYDLVCECPKCKRSLAAARFAPHLEKCMGMGRNSSRIASRRLATAATAPTVTPQISEAGSSGSKSSGNGSHSSASTAMNGEGSEEEHYVEDDEDDEEWTMERKRKNKRSLEKFSSKKKGGAFQRLRISEPRGKRGFSPSVGVDSPLSISNDGNYGDEDDFLTQHSSSSI